MMEWKAVARVYDPLENIDYDFPLIRGSHLHVYLRHHEFSYWQDIHRAAQGKQSQEIPSD